MPQIADLDHHTEIYEELVPPCALIGRFAEALRFVEASRRALAAADPTSSDPCDRDGARGEGADGRLAVDPGADRSRRAARRREPRDAVHPERPLAAGRGGRPRIRRRPRGGAPARGAGARGRPRGLRFRLFGPRVRLALLRDELDSVEQMLGEDVARRGHDWMFTSAMVSTRLDGLLALGRLDEVEREAAPLLSVEAVLRPFAQRALGVARQDDALLRAALEGFESYRPRLPRRGDAASTRGLSGGRAARARARSGGRAARRTGSPTPRTGGRRRSSR